MEPKYPFAAVTRLKERTPSGSLEVTHGSYTWVASFQWFPPASPTEIDGFLAQFPGQLPPDYLQFLAEVSNGAVLFKDQHSQWGFQIYGAGEFPLKQVYWRETYSDIWLPHHLAFAELLGESHVIAFDLERKSKNGSSFAIVEANPLDPVPNWFNPSRSFHEWLDHLITAQGDKYWEWF